MLKEFVDLGTVRPFATYKDRRAFIVQSSRKHSRMKAIQIEPMSYMQNWVDQLNPVAAFPSIAIIFLIASIAGWYVGNLIQWLRR
jgi:hypothetical protein